MLKKTRKRLLKILGFLSVGILVLIIYALYLLPLPDSIIGFRSGETTKLYDRNGVLLYEVLRPEEGRRTKLSFAQFPKKLIDATLAAEDSNYYDHWGIDFFAVLRAIWLNTKHQEIVSGGSTITQQLVRNFLGTTRDRSLYNKFLESLYALRLNQIESKDAILEKYLNTVYYGNLSYGIEASALNYFDHHVYDLDLAQTALIAGIPKNPTLYNPLTHFDDAKQRQEEVLDRMVTNAMITNEEAESAKIEKLSFTPQSKKMRAPHAVQTILDEIEKDVGKEQLLYGGIKIQTTIDVYLSDTITRIIEKNIKNLEEKNVKNGAVMVVDNHTGQILAMVGSKDFYDTSIDGEVNVVLRKRQPGSAFKPITYSAAFQKGWTPATTILDIPTKFMTEEGNPYAPKNFDLEYHGMVTVRDALANSYNIPAVKALEFAGTKNVLLLAKTLGITSLTKDSDYYGLALTLGDGEIQLYDLVQAFSVFANQGIKKSFSFFNANDSLGEKQKRIPDQSVLNADIAYLITNMLADNNARLPSFGDNSPLNIPHIASKTGTSRNFKDNWAIGYSNDFTVGVWVGNNDSSSMINISGVEGAGPILRDTFALLSKNFGAPNVFPKPSTIIQQEICLPSGLLPSTLCPQRRMEVFIKGTEPKETDALWIDQKGKTVLTLPPELQSWARKQGYPLAINTQTKNYLKILNPSNMDEFKIDASVPIQYQKITFQADHSPDIRVIEWFRNGKSLGIGESKEWTLQTGNYTITAISGDIKDSIVISVEK